jgi:hypothetical protein
MTQNGALNSRELPIGKSIHDSYAQDESSASLAIEMLTMNSACAGCRRLVANRAIAHSSVP